MTLFMQKATLRLSLAAERCHYYLSMDGVSLFKSSSALESRQVLSETTTL